MRRLIYASSRQQDSCPGKLPHPVAGLSASVCRNTPEKSDNEVDLVVILIDKEIDCVVVVVVVPFAVILLCQMGSHWYV